jgi:hypothetical protein
MILDFSIFSWEILVLWIIFSYVFSPFKELQRIWIAPDLFG